MKIDEILTESKFPTRYQLERYIDLKYDLETAEFGHIEFRARVHGNNTLYGVDYGGHNMHVYAMEGYSNPKIEKEAEVLKNKILNNAWKIK